MTKEHTETDTGRNIALLVVICLVVILRVYASLVGGQTDPDLFWHLSTGRYILTHHEIPARDVFSWYGQEHKLPWVTQEWLFDSLLYCVWSLGGFGLIFMLTALLDGLLFALVWWLARIRGASPLMGLLIGMTVFLGTWPYVAPRPQLVTYCLLVTTASLLEKGKWYYVLPIVLFEMNSHGGVWPIYILLIAFYAIPKKLSILAAAMALIPVNPHGLGMVAYPFKTVGYTDVKVIQEWAHLALADNWVNLIFYGTFLVRIRKRTLPVKDGLLALVLISMGFIAIRHVPFFYILVLPLMAPHLSPSSPSERSILHQRRRALEFGFATVLGLVLVLQVQRILPLKIDVDQQYPKEAVAHIRANDIHRIFNVWGHGGYLIYNGVAPLIDGRADPFIPAYNGGDDIMGEYAAAFQLRQDWQPFLEKHNIRYLLLGKNIPFYRAIRHARSVGVVYEDQEFAVLRYDAAK